MSGEQPDTLGLARAVAESILASPKLDPGLPKHEIPSTVTLSATSATSSRHRTMTLAKDIASESSLTSTTSSHLSSPISAFDDLKISDGDDDYYDEIDRKDGKAPDACNLFVGDLARTVTEDQLREVFSKQGDVIAVDIKRDKITQNNLGYGFVQFKTRDQAVKAREALHGAEVGGRKIRIGWAQKNTTLFIGDLDGTVTTQQLREIFLKYGPLVEDETFVKAGSGKFGFVRFKHRTDAERAKADMNRKMIGSRPIRIGWGDNNIQKHCVHVQFNPSQGAHLIEAYFRKHFEQFGVVQNVSLPRFANRRLKGYGFIHFQENNEGEKAAGKAIATLAESKVANVTIRCSYGKRQIYNRYRRNPKNYARGGFGREPIYSQAWAITMPGGWPPVQPYGSQTTQMGMGGLMGSVSPPGPQGQSPYFMAQPAPDSLGRRFSQDQSSTPIYMHQPTHSPQQTPQTAYYPSLRETELSPMMYYQQSPASGYNYPLQGQGQVVFDDLSLAHTEAAQAYFKQAMAATGQQMKSEQGLGSLGGLTTAPLSVPSSPLQAAASLSSQVPH